MGLDVGLCFEAIKRGIDRADANLTASACFDLLSNGDPVSPIAQTQERQDDGMLEFTREDRGSTLDIP
jgi:hypothetical protein